MNARTPTASSRLAVLCSLVLACTTAPASVMNLIANGSFETGLDPHGLPQTLIDGVLVLHNGSTGDLGSWTLAGGTSPSFTDRAGNSQPANLWSWVLDTHFTAIEPSSAPQDGSRLLNLTGVNESLSQSFSVSAGTTYTVSYWEQSRVNLGSIQQATITLALGTASGTLSQTTLGTEAVWTNYTFSFTPDTTTLATLKFQETGLAGGSGTLLDNVTVFVPEPSTVLLLGVGSLLVWKRAGTRR